MSCEICSPPPPRPLHIPGEESCHTLDKGVCGPRRPSGCRRKDKSVFNVLALYPDSLVAQSIAKSKYSLKMEAFMSSETLLTTQYSTLRRNSDEHSYEWWHRAGNRSVSCEILSIPTIAANRTLRPKKFMFYVVCCLLYLMSLCKHKEVPLNSTKFFHTNSCTFTYNYVLVF
jgi:hypothetical protein